MSDITDYWRIDGAAGELPIDYRATTARTPMRGESMDLPVVFSGYSDSADGSWPDWRERYQAVMETYGPHAGSFTVYDLTSGRASYTETHSSDSLLVALRPPASVPERIGGYALVEEISDEYLLRGKATFPMSVVYLASLDDYPSIAEARNHLATEGI